MDPLGEHPDEMWDEEDGFFYDVLRLPDGSGARIKVRSLVGLLPLCADDRDRGRRHRPLPADRRACGRLPPRIQDLLVNIADPFVPGVHGRRLLSLVNEDKLRRILARMLDEERFLGPHGIRSISRWHLDHPYASMWPGPSTGCSTSRRSPTTGMFGGNSNWRGPVWFPINLLLIRALIQHYRYYGNDLKVECPTGSGKHDDAVRGGPGAVTPPRQHVPARRRRAAPGLRRHQAVPGRPALARPHPFYEYFHGDNGAGLGASHQTGWTGLVARLIQSTGQFDADTVLEDRQWPMARPYRRLAAAPMPSVTTAREARA